MLSRKPQSSPEVMPPVRPAVPAAQNGPSQLSQADLFPGSPDTLQARPPARLHSSSAAISRDEMNLAEFPLTVLSTRVDPKVKTLEFSDFQRGKDGELTERKWIITGADKFGLPTATDDDVILGLIRLTMDDGFRSRKVYFTRYELLRALQWSTEGRSYTRLVKSLDRLSGVRIRASNSFYDNSSKSYQTKNFGIIDAYELNDHRNTRKPKRRLSTGSSADNLDEGEGKSFFLWSEMLFNSFRSGFIKKLDLDLYFSLRSSVSRRLYRYLDKHFYFRSTVERPLLFLAFEKLGISRNYKYVSSVKQQLEPAAEELVAVGYLSQFEFLGKGEQAIVRFHAARAGAQPIVHQRMSDERDELQSPDRSAQQPAAAKSAVRPADKPSGAEAISQNEFPGSSNAGASGDLPETARDEERRLSSQLIEALVSRGISIMQAKRLLAERELMELRRIDSILSYYDHLVESQDAKVSRNKVGFLYRAVETPSRFHIPASFQDPIGLGHSNSQMNGSAQTGLGRGGRGGSSFAKATSAPLSRFPAGFPAGTIGQRAAGRSENRDFGSSAAPELQQARLRRGYFEFVSSQVSGILASMKEGEREEIRRRVEEKMSCLGTALSKERFEEAVQGCMREEVSRAHKIPDFRTWAAKQDVR